MSDLHPKIKQKSEGVKFDFKNLQIGDTDLMGNVFNGHNLHLYLREKNIDSSHLVWHKESNDKNTYVIAHNRQQLNSTVHNIQKEYSLSGVLNPLTYDILYNELFLEADIVHYHLIHNINFDLQLLPILTRLKPTVWTVHDPWALSGHCIEHFNCDKWKTGCGDCPFLNTPYPIEKDNTALNFEIKKLAIQNSKLDIVVASKYMMDKLKSSPIFCDSKIYLIPFGINQDIFKPVDKKEAKNKLSIPANAFVITFRSENSALKKGLEYINCALEKIKTKKEIFIITVGGGEGSVSDTNKKKYKQINFGWIKNEKVMADIYSASDLLLMPSIEESFGLMAVEAMSCGTLPIVLEGTALPEVVDSMNCGIAVPKDKEEYARVVQYYIDNDEERETRANKCLELAKKKYNKNLYVKNIIEVYRGVMSKHSLDIGAKKILQQLKRYMSADSSSIEPDWAQPVLDVPTNTVTPFRDWLVKIIRRILLCTPGFRKMQTLEDLIFANQVKTEKQIENLINLVNSKI